ncbi:MAG: hypothetical protein HDR24_03945 [Lachnospiraceae bacterium]|nr:hypothetical protein [Lachnospiraceae bacterium]
MEIENTKDFQDFIVGQEISDEKAENIEQIIAAFSEYIVAVNPEYVYNKTYLRTYVEDFIKCQKALKLKYQILLNNILVKILAAGIERECIINIDDVWKVEKGKIILCNSINPYIVTRNKMQFELELIHENGFVIAEEINIDEEYENMLDVCISTFIERRKELLEDET